MTDTVPQRTSPVTPKGLNHLVLNVRDLGESHRFWSGLLGFVQVGELEPRHGITMRFYSGVDDGMSHHDLALAEMPHMDPPPERWNMKDNTLAVNHVAITYPDRASWLEQVQFLTDNGVEIHRRIDHGMTHSVYISDPNGYGVEVLYDLPREVWEHDVNGALNHATVLDTERPLADDTDYPTEFVL